MKLMVFSAAWPPMLGLSKLMLSTIEIKDILAKVIFIGFFLACFSFLLGAWYVLQKLIGMDLTPGLSTTVLFITFFSGVQLLGLGLIGEYVGRIYDEVKKRPMSILDKKVNFDEV